KSLGRGARPAGQEVPSDHGRAHRASRPCEATCRIRPGEPDRDRPRRRRRGGALARPSAGARRMEQRSGAAVSVPGLASVPSPVGTDRRLRLGARARLLPRAVRRVQRDPGETATSAARARAQHPSHGMTPVPGPLRVLMTVDAVGGVWHYAMTLVEALAGLERTRSIEFLLACIGPAPSVEQQRVAAALPGVRLVHRGYRLEWMDDPWDDVARAGRWLRECAAEFQPDLVHLNGYVHAAMEWRVPVLVVGHSCVLSWWEAVRGEPAPPEWELYRHAVAGGLARARSVVAPTHAMLSALERHYGLPEDRRVISNGSFVQ